MPILFAQIANAPPVNSDRYVDIPGLTLQLPPASAAQTHALIILNVPTAYAEGHNNPGISFAINVNTQVVADGSWTYDKPAPDSSGSHPYTLVVRVNLQNEQHSHVRAQWQSVRGSTATIPGFASISAILG
jgi:hypothetical protein